MQRILHSIVFSIVALASVMTVSAATPFIDAIDPSSIATGLGPAQINVYGANFAPGATIGFGGQQFKPDALNPNEITFTVPPSLLVNARSAAVTVMNPVSPGATADSNPIYFRIAAPAYQVFTQTSGLVPLSQQPNAIAVADFNNDGHLDFAVAGGAGIEVQLGDGTGKFARSAIIALLQGDEILSITVADFNGDGIPDIVCGSQTRNLYILLGDGAGQFRTAVLGLPFEGISGVYAGDFNSDGNPDLVVSSSGAALAFELLVGDGTGAFLPATPVRLPAGFAFANLALGDFNSDGKLDIACASARTSDSPGSGSAGALTIFTGDGAGNFSQTSSVVLPFVPQLVAGDFNNDGNLDLYIGSGATFLGDGTGSFTAVVTSNPPESATAGVTIGDFNGDGIPDLVFSEAGSLSVATGVGDGTFTFVSASRAVASGFPVSGDFNGDGLLDVAIAAPGPMQVEIDLQTPRPPDTHAYAITDLCPGQTCALGILGNTGVAGGSDLAYYPGLGLVNIFQMTGHHFQAHSINRAGIIAGTADSGIAAVWAPQSSNLLFLNTVAGNSVGVATFINDRNQISVLDAPAASDLVPGDSVNVTAILDNGIVLGADMRGAFVYAPGVGLTHLPSNGSEFSFFFNDAGEVWPLTPYPGELFTPGSGITTQPNGVLSAQFNTLGQFVGYSLPQQPIGSPNFLSLFTATGGDVSLGSIVAPQSYSPAPGGFNINDRGQIVVTANRPDGSLTTLLLTPILPGAPTGAPLLTGSAEKAAARSRFSSRAGSCEEISPPITVNMREVCPKSRATPTGRDIR